MKRLEHIILTRDFLDFISRTRIPLQTKEVSVGLLGGIKTTSSGNPIYNKQYVNIGDIYILNINNNKIFQLYDYKKGVYVLPKKLKIGNAFSMRRKGSFIPSSKKIETEDIWKLENREVIPRWSRVLSGFVDSFYEYYNPDIESASNYIGSGQLTMPSKEVIVEALTEEVKKYYASACVIEVAPLTSDLYTKDYFDGQSMGSCMSFFNVTYYGTRKNVYIYDKINEVEGLLFKNKEDEYIGRCLLWQGKYTDKIYARGHDERLLIEKTLAVHEGEYESLSCENVVMIDAPSLLLEDYPYMDSVAYLTKDNMITNNGELACMESFQCTQLEEDDDMVQCTRSDQWIHIDDAVWIEEQDSYIHKNYAKHSRKYNRWFNDDDVAYVDDLDDYVLQSEVEWCRDRNTYILRSDAIGYIDMHGREDYEIVDNLVVNYYGNQILKRYAELVDDEKSEFLDCWMYKSEVNDFASKVKLSYESYTTTEMRRNTRNWMELEITQMLNAEGQLIGTAGGDEPTNQGTDDIVMRYVDVNDDQPF